MGEVCKRCDVLNAEHDMMQKAVELGGLQAAKRLWAKPGLQTGLE